MKKRAPKRSRTKRAKNGSVVITKRDIDVMILTGLCRYLSAEQLARELFPSINRCRRRVRQLFDAGLLRITLASSIKSNLVSLTRKGKAVIGEHAPKVAQRIRLLERGINLTGVEHHLGVVDARLYAAALSERLNKPLVHWDNAGGRQGRELGLPHWHLQPDGLAEFARGVYVAVEVDCGSEPRSVLTDKLERYNGVAHEGTVDALWIVVLGGVQRQQSILGLVENHGLEQWARVMSREHIVARPARDLPARAGNRVEDPNMQSATIQKSKENHGV